MNTTVNTTNRAQKTLINRYGANMGASYCDSTKIDILGNKKDGKSSTNQVAQLDHVFRKNSTPLVEPESQGFSDKNRGPTLIIQRSRKLTDEFKSPGGRAKYSEECLGLMNEWLLNSTSPYPDREELECLAERTGLTRNQVNNWFTNTRKRKLKGCKIPPIASSQLCYERRCLPRTAKTAAERFTQVLRPNDSQSTQPVRQLSSHDAVLGDDSDDDDVEVVKVVCPDRPFCANDAIHEEITPVELDALFEATDLEWGTRFAALVASHLMTPTPAKRCNKASESMKFHQGKMNQQHFELALTKKDHFICPAADQIDLDGFELDLGFLDDFEGGDDEFGIMAEFYSQNIM